MRWMEQGKDAVVIVDTIFPLKVHVLVGVHFGVDSSPSCKYHCGGVPRMPKQPINYLFCMFD